MSQSFVSRLALSLAASPALFALLLFIHGGALWSAMLTPLPGIFHLGIGAAVALSAYRSIAVHALRKSRLAVIGLEESQGKYAVQWNHDKQWSSGRLLASFVHPAMVVLCLRIPGRRMPVNLVIFQDGVEHDAFRALRARLTIYAG